MTKAKTQKRQPVQIERDRRNIARLYLKGVFQADIGEELGLSQPMVSRDLKVIREQWAVERVDDFNERKNIELAKVDNLELEYWQAWIRSQEDAETKKMVRFTDGKTHSQDEDKETDEKAVKRGNAKTRQEQSVKGQVGDPRFLKGVEWCIDKRWDDEYNATGTKQGEQTILTSIPAEMLSPAMLDVYRDVRLRNHYDYILKGGRGGTKSSTVAELVIYLIINNPEYHALVVRERLNTLRDSAYAEIEWAAGKLGVGDLFQFRKSPLMITYKPTEQNIYFRGANDPLKIRGIKPKFGKIAVLWVEEAHRLGGESVIRDVIQSALRGEEDLKSESQDISISFISYNPPPSETNWINRWVEERKGKEGVFIKHSTYLDVPKEWLGRRFLNEADHLKEKNEKAYRHEYLGEVTGLGGMVFENIELREITDEEISQFDNIKHGIDWGYFPHPFAYGKMHYDVNHEIIYIFNEYYGYKHSNEETFEEIQKHGYNDTKDLIIADSSENKSVARYRYLGANVRGAEKGAGSVRAGVQWLQTRRKIVIDPERAPLHAKQFLYYELDMAKDGSFIEVFPDKNDDTIDVVRYALNLEWRRSDR